MYPFVVTTNRTITYASQTLQCLADSVIIVTDLINCSVHHSGHLFVHASRLFKMNSREHFERPCLRAVFTGAGPHYPCSWPVNAAREHGCYFCSRKHGPLRRAVIDNKCKTCSLYTLLTAMDQKPQQALKDY